MQAAQPTYFLLLGAAISLASAATSAIITLVIAVGNRRAEERRNFRDLVLKAALEEWKNWSDMIKTQATLVGVGGTLYPLASFIVYMSRVLEPCTAKNPNAEDISRAITEANALIETMIAAQKTKPS